MFPGVYLCIGKERKVLMGRRERNTAYDVLRIVSAFSIVMLHVSGAFITDNPVGSTGFRIANFLNSINRFGVPIFVMLSGAIFLSESRQTSVRRLWQKNILRMLVIYGVWSFAYYVYQSLYWWKFDFWKYGIVRTITGCVYASEHFWFLFMIVGLYALVPFLRTWLHHADKKELDYFTMLFFIFQICRTTITILIDKSLVDKISDMFKIWELSWYLGYFVLGYILVHYGISARIKKLLYALVPVGIVVNFAVSDHMSIKQGMYTAGIYDSFGVFTFIHSVALFVFVNDWFQKRHIKENAKRLCTEMALNTLGIYLMHIAVLDFCDRNQIMIGNIDGFAGVILLSVLIYIFCGGVSALLRRIPVIGKIIL